MNSLLQSTQPIVLFVLVFLAVLLFALLLLRQLPKKPAKTPAKTHAKKEAADWLDSPESGRDLSEASVCSTAAQANEAATVAASSTEDALAPSAIVAEVCSLRSPAREDVARRYRGRRVRWTLCLSAISEREGQGASHTVRMYPSGRSPYTCGVYFTASAAECAVLQAAGRNDAFVVEGVIDKVEDRDIDLRDVQMAAQKAA